MQEILTKPTKLGILSHAVVLTALLAVGVVYSSYEDLAAAPAGLNNRLAAICDPSSVPGLLKLKANVSVPGREFFQIYKSTFELGEGDEMRIIHATTDSLGFTHYHFQQLYKGLPVEGGEYRVHERNGRVEKANGIIITGLQFNVTPVLSEPDALTSALKYIGADKYMWEDPRNEAWLKAEQDDDQATFYPKGEFLLASSGEMETASFHLAYRFDIYSERPVGRFYVYVDAKTGEVFRKQTRIYDSDALGFAYTLYNGSRFITTDWTGSNYRLRESNPGGSIQTLNMRRGTSYGNSVDFYDDDGIIDNVWHSDGAAYNAHWGAESVYDYFLAKHARDGFNGSGATTRSYIHYYDIGDTTCELNCNAWWDGSRLTYGDGDCCGLLPFTPLDFVGHEFTHAVTQYEAHLDYRNESGALNESFSDVFGTAVEFYRLGSNANWLMGEDIFSGQGYFRSLSNPNDRAQPDTYQGDYWHPLSSDPNKDNDYGGVHTNSGVQNHWFYLLSEGGTGINDNGDRYSVTGIGIDKASTIAYRNLTTYLLSTSSYTGAAELADDAAWDLYGQCSQERWENARAWYAVGLPSPYIIRGLGMFDRYYRINPGRIWIQGANSVHSGADVNIGSLTEVRIMPGFHAEPGSNVRVFIGCGY